MSNVDKILLSLDVAVKPKLVLRLINFDASRTCLKPY